MTSEQIEIPAPEPRRVPEDDQEMTFFQHLGELRSRLLRAVAGLIPAVAIGWIFKKEIKDFLVNKFWRNSERGGKVGAPDSECGLFLAEKRDN